MAAETLLCAAFLDAGSFVDIEDIETRWRQPKGASSCLLAGKDQVRLAFKMIPRLTRLVVKRFILRTFISCSLLP